MLHATTSTEAAAHAAGADRNRWLLLALRLRARPSNARVKTWRRLQQIGALSLKNSVYVLPNSAQALEDFEWLRSEVQGLKGEANVFSASSVNGLDEQEIIEQFQIVRAGDYKHLIKDLRTTHAQTRRASSRDQDLARTVRQLADRLTRLRAIDFFAAPGREQAEQALTILERSMRPLAETRPTTPGPQINPKDYQGRVWVTRPRPGVDRFACAWLISRFIDRRATFDFVVDPKDVPHAVPFDMYGAGFAHEGDMCTFEVLQARFHIVDAGVRRIAEIVHDIDLKDDRFRSAQAPGIATLIDGLRAAFSDDTALLAQGIILFDALHRGLQPQQTSRSRRPTVLPKTFGG